MSPGGYQRSLWVINSKDRCCVSIISIIILIIPHGVGDLSVIPYFDLQSHELHSLVLNIARITVTVSPVRMIMF